MPPTRRNARPVRPPVPRRRNPRVAGLRRPGADSDSAAAKKKGTDVRAEEPAEEPGSPAAVDLDDREEPETVETAAEPEGDTEDLGDSDDIGDVDDVAGSEDTEDLEAEPAAKPAPRPGRPAGKRKRTGTTAPSDLRDAEAWAGRPKTAPRRRLDGSMVAAISLGVVAVLLGGLAFFFGMQVSRINSGVDTNNQALTDGATTAEVKGQLQTALEAILSYDYNDLAKTDAAVEKYVTGDARCEYDHLFGQVRELAPKQKIVLTTVVREIGVTRLDGDLADVLVFVDQTTTRTGKNGGTTASGAQFGVTAQRDGELWKIVKFDMLGQPLPNGEQLPDC